jgi:hypothetical protein
MLTVAAPARFKAVAPVSFFLRLQKRHVAGGAPLDSTQRHKGTEQARRPQELIVELVGFLG